MKRAVVLLSGGVDSSTSLAIAKAEGHELYAISFDYGQRHRIELESAGRVASSLGVTRHLVTRFDMRAIGGSALTDNIDVPKSQESGVRSRKSEEKQEVIPVTYVPARNTIFLSFALAWAEVLRAQDIFIGANAVDYSGYPDCRPEYLKAFETMANLATKIAVEGAIRFSIRAPLLSLTKSEIIKKGAALGLDYSLTWSCYDPQPSGMGRIGYKACGRCDSCLFRKKGFDEAGIADPAF
ncbi:MAG TPA: 7-cyano-7-deazaguanine synthase QueC [Dissulfurispiraceae bacterium]|nr:7-cyano-7-deazaguanine synthase QueC [Dissulfurispiraceae bacterium]